MNKLSQKSAEAILSNRVMVSNTEPKRIKINSVSSQEFAWKNPVEGGSRTYKIVNTNALTPYHFEKAQELYNQGEFDAACNESLSFNCDPELADKLLAIGFANAEFDEIANKDGVMITVIKKLRPIVIEAAPKATFNFAKKDATTSSIKSPVVEEFAEVA
jgi:hypothetical protein